jgi:hypothetical protein
MIAQQHGVQVESAENHPSGAKARGFLSTIFGTAEAVPFQNTNFTSDCEGRSLSATH